MSHRNVAHVFFFALKGSDEYEQEVPEALYGIAPVLGVQKNIQKEIL